MLAWEWVTARGDSDNERQGEQDTGLLPTKRQIDTETLTEEGLIMDYEKMARDLEGLIRAQKAFENGEIDMDGYELAVAEYILKRDLLRFSKWRHLKFVLESCVKYIPIEMWRLQYVDDDWGDYEVEFLGQKFIMWMRLDDDGVPYEKLCWSVKLIR